MVIFVIVAHVEHGASGPVIARQAACVNGNCEVRRQNIGDFAKSILRAREHVLNS